MSPHPDCPDTEPHGSHFVPCTYEWVAPGSTVLCNGLATPPTCTGCAQPLTEVHGINTCSTDGCPGNLHAKLDALAQASPPR